MDTVLELALLAVIVIPTAAAVAYGVARSTLFAGTALLVTFAITDAIRDAPDLAVTLGTLTVYPLDIACASLALVAAYRLLTVRIAGLQLLVALLGLLLLIHIARGVSAFGAEPAITASRSWIYFVVPLLFAATTTVFNDRVWRYTALLGLGLVFVGLPYLVTDGLHSAATFIDRQGDVVTARPVVAAGALIVLQAVVLFLAMSWRSPYLARAAAVSCAVGVLVLQHRTVWAAGLVLAALGFLMWSRQNAREAPERVFGATGLTILALPLLAGGIWATSVFRESLQETARDNSTFGWRTESWRELLTAHDSFGELLFGGPAGESWARTLDGNVVTVSPHSAYVEAVLRFGIPGLLVFLALFVVLWRRREFVGRVTGLGGIAVGALVASQVMFSVAYTLSAVQGLFAGLLVAALAQAAPQAAPLPASPVPSRVRSAW